LFIKKSIIIILTVVAVISLQSCSETLTDVGAELLGQDQIQVKNLDTAVDSVEMTSSYFKRVVNLGTSSRILLGSRDNVQAGVLLRFNFPLIDTLAAQILDGSVAAEDSWIQMNKVYRYGPETAQMNFTAHQVNSGWTTVGFNADSLSQLQYEQGVNSALSYSVSDTITIINLQPSLPMSWLRAAADTAIAADYGVYLKPDTINSNKIMGYHALGSADNSLVPRLFVILRRAVDGVADTLIYSAFADLGYVKGELPVVSEENIVVQAGLEAASKISFDLSSIPETAVINKAELVLQIDSLQSSFGDNFSNALIASFIVDTVSLDSLTRSVALNPSGKSYRGDLTVFVQDWVRSKNNSGLLITASGRLSGVDKYIIRGVNAPAAVRPRLIITYTTKL
jgi:hypothetical protein